ncbi:response regulator [Asticcacaulis sp. EMRT-3]|uniref:response regulator n=1 Tax=Asticcacaulis sp. EMRT-3 TaxID=3040349 RepID=UPI0024AF88FD|nr:response regulator [Asticcacaulis sp. EMRT-3]MDI7776062.1 response regulator [Asticcacaulis sp. EMRT-3]
MRLLCVEDNSTLRKMIDLMLAATGIDVDFASDGEEAVEAYQVNEYDAVLMDMEMPRMAGLAAARAIRQVEDGFCLGYTPILFLSGHDDEAHIEQSHEAGGDAYLAKPFTSESLIGAIASLLHGRSATRLSAFTGGWQQAAY